MGVKGQKLARAAHARVATVRTIELGEMGRTPGYEMMEVMARILEMDPEDIYRPGDLHALNELPFNRATTLLCYEQGKLSS